MVHILS